MCSTWFGARSGRMAITTSPWVVSMTRVFSGSAYSAMCQQLSVGNLWPACKAKGRRVQGRPIACPFPSSPRMGRDRSSLRHNRAKPTARSLPLQGEVRWGSGLLIFDLGGNDLVGVRDRAVLFLGALFQAIDQLHAVDHRAEHGILPIKEAGVRRHHEELGVERVGVLRAGRANGAGLEALGVEFGFDVGQIRATHADARQIEIGC